MGGRKIAYSDVEVTDRSTYRSLPSSGCAIRRLDRLMQGEAGDASLEQ